MKTLLFAIALIFAIGAGPSTAPAPKIPAIGEKEFAAAVKEYVRQPAGESAAVRKLRQQGVIDGLMGREVLMKGKLGKEEVDKKGKISVEVVEDDQARTIVVKKTRDSVTGVKIGKDITIGGTITSVTIKPAETETTIIGKVYHPARIDVFVK